MLVGERPDRVLVGRRQRLEDAQDENDRRFADREGREYLAKFYNQYKSLSAQAMLDRLAQRDLSPAELAAYDAPFPSRIHMTGVRVFPSLIDTIGDEPTNEGAEPTSATRSPSAAKKAPTVRALDIETVHTSGSSPTAQFDDQPLKSKPSSGDAVRVTSVPLSYSAEHVSGPTQSMPAGDDGVDAQATPLGRYKKAVSAAVKLKSGDFEQTLRQALRELAR